MPAWCRTPRAGQISAYLWPDVTHIWRILEPCLIPFWRLFGPYLTPIWFLFDAYLNPIWRLFRPYLTPIYRLFKFRPYWTVFDRIGPYFAPLHFVRTTPLTFRLSLLHFVRTIPLNGQKTLLDQRKFVIGSRCNTSAHLHGGRGRPALRYAYYAYVIILPVFVLRVCYKLMGISTMHML